MPNNYENRPEYHEAIRHSEIKQMVEPVELIDAIKSLPQNLRVVLLIESNRVSHSQNYRYNASYFAAMRSVANQLGDLPFDYIRFYIRKYKDYLEEEFPSEFLGLERKKQFELLKKHILEMSYQLKEAFIRYYLLRQKKPAIAEALGIQTKNAAAHIKNSFHSVQYEELNEFMLSSLHAQTLVMTDEEIHEFEVLIDPAYKKLRVEKMEINLNTILNKLCYELPPTSLRYFLEIEIKGISPTQVAKSLGTTPGAIRATYQNSIYARLEHFLGKTTWWRRGEIGQHMTPEARSSIRATISDVLSHHEELTDRMNYNFFKEAMYLIHYFEWMPDLIQDLKVYIEHKMTRPKKARWQYFLEGEPTTLKPRQGMGELSWAIKNVETFIIQSPKLSLTEKERILGINYKPEEISKKQRNLDKRIIQVYETGSEEANHLHTQIDNFLTMPYIHDKITHLRPGQAIVLDLTLNHTMGPKAIQEYINEHPTAFTDDFNVPVTRAMIKSIKYYALRNLAHYLELNITISHNIRKKLLDSKA